MIGSRCHVVVHHWRHTGLVTVYIPKARMLWGPLTFVEVVLAEICGKATLCDAYLASGVVKSRIARSRRVLLLLAAISTLVRATHRERADPIGSALVTV